jgi:hypothetical protein
MDRMHPWTSHAIRLGLMEDPRKVPVVVGRSGSMGGSLGRFQNLGKRLRLVGQLDQAPKQKVKELEVVLSANPSST